MSNRFFPTYDEYKITSKYGMRTLKGVKKMHNGIDLVAKHKDGYGAIDWITAHSSGVVHSTGFDSSAGNYVYIEVAPGVLMAYFHLKDNTTKVKKGDKVAKGDVIGYMGSTGNSTGAHLHFGIKDNGKWVDPTPYLDKDYVVEVDNSTDYIVHQVVKGETLSKIGAKYGVDYNKIAKDNGIKDVNSIMVGQELKIYGATSKPVEPTYTTYTVQKGDSLWAIARKTMGAGSTNNINKIKELNGLKGNIIFPGQTLKIPRS